MKKFAIVLMLLFSLLGCSNEKAMEPDTSMNAAWLMKLNIDSQNYDSFQSLFFEGSKDNVSRETFEQFGELTTSGTNFRSYELLTFDNGEMLLVEFAPKSEDDEQYKIVNVKEVPDDMKTLFED